MEQSAALKGKPRDSVQLYSEECIEYLKQALKKADSEDEDDFRRYYEAPSDVHGDTNGRAWSSDDESVTEAEPAHSSSEEDEKEGPVSDQTQTPVTSSTVPAPPKKQATTQQKKLAALNEKQKDAAIRKLGRPPCAQLPLPEPDNDVVMELPYALLSKEERLSNAHTMCQAYLRLSTALAKDKKPVVVLLMRSGRFAGAIFSGSKCLHHTTSTRYTIRKGQGKAQSAQDGQRKPKSVGSQLRRAGEEALREDVKAFLLRHKTHVEAAGVVLLSCPKTMMKGFFGDNNSLLSRGDQRLRKVPLDVGRPTFEAAVAVFEIMMMVNIMEKPVVSDEIVPENTLSTIGEVNQTIPEEPKVVKEKSTEMIPLTRLHELAATANLAELVQFLDTESDFIVDQQAGEDFMTPLHYAAAAAEGVDPTTAAACVTALLVQGHAAPTVLDARRRAPYFLATHEKVRESFRMARAILGEEYCNWDNAKVGPPLTLDDVQQKKDKAAEKKKRQRARQKEKKGRERAQAGEMEKQRQEEEDRLKQEDEAKRVRAGLQPKTTTATNVCDFCQKKCRGKRRSQMFIRLDYAYCGTECVQNHKRELMAAAAVARFGS
mmetsp:Transcript_880/g.1448  ORF Transcript_880/g.1448 Transcript_880/m.1448 type:complete len:601 (+) Transcript_880:83-1885(+)